MVGQRRFGPLIALTALGLALLAARLFAIQVVQHGVWAREAAGLLRSSTVVPYHRGRILDARGRELVRDEDVYQVELHYRDFRRGHPLGQVAHAWSSLTLSPLPLDAVLPELEPLALALCALTPAEIDAFAHGAGLARLGVAPSADPLADLTARRASDLRFYLAELCGLDRAGRLRLRSARGEPAWERPVLELACTSATSGADALAERAAELRARLQAVPSDLELLARHFALAPAADEPAGATIAALVAELELRRREVEDGAADELFEQAAGFAPGRISGAALAAIDLDWIALLLRWDAQRLAAWSATRRAAWEDELAGRARRLRVEVSLAAPEERAARLLDGLAELYARHDPTRPSRAAAGWRRTDELAALGELATLFAAGAAGAARAAPVLPLQDDALRRAAPDGDGWALAARVLEPAGADAARAAAWRALAADVTRWLGEDGEAALARVLDAWEARFAAAFDAALAELARAAVRETGAPLALAPGRLERAQERAEYVLKDRSSRPLLVQRRPSYELVHLLTRRRDRYAGFRVRDATRRVALEHNPDGTPLAGFLIGSVRQPDLREVLRQRAAERELRALRREAERSDEEAARIVALSADLLRDDELRGGSGLESYLDRELSGRNGYRETDGLQERSEGRGQLFQPPVDGADVVLTLDLDLQRAAQAALAQPEFDADEPWADRLWLAHPVGAICLITPDGAVLAAASEPTREHEAPERRLAERARALDRTARRPTFNPPGSVLKPFVAAWALEYQGLDPAARFECALLADGKPGYKTMHCTGLHGSVDLADALRVSCNAYFARLGEELYTPRAYRQMAHAFGFDAPTGIRGLGSDGRSGLREDFALHPELEQRLEQAAVRMMGANGLGVIEATPLQVARATAGLLTGRLPALRLVASIGGAPVPAEAQEVEVGEEHLAFVRRALAAVVAAPGGSAFGKGLDPQALGFSVALKTGSADYAPFRDPRDDPRGIPGRMRKHTWIAGWFPVEDPQAVLVVYLHDVAETSSHTAVWIARQLLSSAAVRAWLVERGVELGNERREGR